MAGMELFQTYGKLMFDSVLFYLIPARPLIAPPTSLPWHANVHMNVHTHTHTHIDASTNLHMHAARSHKHTHKHSLLLPYPDYWDNDAVLSQIELLRRMLKSHISPRQRQSRTVCVSTKQWVNPQHQGAEMRMVLLYYIRTEGLWWWLLVFIQSVGKSSCQLL